MSKRIAIMTFEVTRRSTENMHYEIIVHRGNRIVDQFEAPTMLQAEIKYENAGYRDALQSGQMIICPSGGAL
jgi:hypothetical protein